MAYTCINKGKEPEGSKAKADIVRIITFFSSFLPFPPLCGTHIAWVVVFLSFSFFFFFSYFIFFFAVGFCSTHRPTLGMDRSRIHTYLISGCYVNSSYVRSRCNAVSQNVSFFFLTPINRLARKKKWGKFFLSRKCWVVNIIFEIFFRQVMRQRWWRLCGCRLYSSGNTSTDGNFPSEV